MTAAQKGVSDQQHAPAALYPPGKTRYPMYRRLGGTQGRSGQAENLVPTGIRSRTVQPLVSRYTDWATGPTLFTVRSLNKKNRTTKRINIVKIKQNTSHVYLIIGSIASNIVQLTLGVTQSFQFQLFYTSIKNIGGTQKLLNFIELYISGKFWEPLIYRNNPSLSADPHKHTNTGLFNVTAGGINSFHKDLRG